MVKEVQAWDDGLVEDIDLIAILRRHHAKAAFRLLNPGLHQGQRTLS